MDPQSAASENNFQEHVHDAYLPTTLKYFPGDWGQFSGTGGSAMELLALDSDNL